MRGKKERARTCTGCGRRGSKDELLRMARGSDGVVRIDGRRRMEGRGAWVHPTADCLAKAESARAIGRAFRGGARRPEDGALLAEARGIVGRLSEVEGDPGGG